MQKNVLLTINVIILICILYCIIPIDKQYLQREQEPIQITESVEYFGIKPISQIEYEELQLKREKREENLWQMLSVNSIPVPYDEERNTFYMPQNYMGNSWLGTLQSTEGFEVYILEDSFFGTQNAISENHVFQLLFVNDILYMEAGLVVTGLPIISINTMYLSEEQTKIDVHERAFDKDFFGYVIVYDPVFEEQYTVTTSYLTYHQKGNLSANWPKKSFSISLETFNGNANKQSLLGMREDEDWKLNSLFSDKTKLREKIANELWNQLAELSDVSEQGGRMEYVEVFVDNSYQGIYGLIEPIDKDKLGLEKGDILYKTLSYVRPSLDELNNAAAVLFCDPYEVKYPNSVNDLPDVWRPMKEYHSLFYWQKNLDYEQALDSINIENFADVYLYIQVIAGADNRYKNQYMYAKYDENEDSYKMYIVPWDVDLSFGNCFIDDHAAFYTVYKPERIRSKAERYMPEPLRKLLEKDFICIYDRILSRWNNYRTSIFSENNMLELINENSEYLVNSGAISRENLRWTQIENVIESTEIESFVLERLDFLEEFMNSAKDIGDLFEE